MTDAPGSTAARSARASHRLGVLSMCAAALFLMLGDAISKHLMETWPIGQVIGVRQAIALAIVLPWALSLGGPRMLRIGHWRLQAMRGALLLAGTWTIMTALHLLPIATVSSIVFASPLFVALLSAPLLGERVPLRVWLAIVVGFVGVLLIVRPGSGAFSLALLLPIGAALLNAMRDIVTRRLSRTDHSISTLFWSTAIVGAGGLLAMPFEWVPVTAPATVWFLLAGVFYVAAQWTMIEALRLAPAALVSPFKYTGLVWALLVGIVVWGDWPDAWLLAGAAIIVGVGIYMTRLSPR
ncbi:MAG: DMT family transporter [Pseudomonadota bacterium]